MNRWIKILCYILGGSLAIVFVLVFLLFRALPSPSDFAKKSAKKVTSQKIEAVAETKSVTSSTTPQTPQAEATSAIDKDGNISLKNVQGRLIVEELMDPQAPASDVCKYLSNAKASKVNGYSVEEFSDHFEKSSLSEDKDPLLQSLKPILKHAFELSSMKKLMVLAEEAEQTEDHSWATKAAFYKVAYEMYYEVTNEKNNFENLVDKTYFVYMLTKAVNKKPELANDPNTQRFCQNIEELINSKDSVSMSEQKAEFEKFLNYSGIDAKDLGYDPNYKTHLAVNWRSDEKNFGVKMTGGWLDSLLADKNSQPNNKKIIKN